jgi:hypothetical protein
VRPEATFCGQCYTDFRPPPPPPSAPIAPAPTATYSAPAADPLTAPLLDVLLPVGAVPVQGAAPQAVPVAAPIGWPCTKCDTLNDFTDPICTVCGAPFLATVSESTKVSLVLPIVGDLGRYGRGQRALIAVGVLAAVLIPLALITLLLTKTPPAGSGTPSTGDGGTSGSSTTTGQPTGPVGSTGDAGTQNN